MPKKKQTRTEMPSTIARSDKHAQAIWQKTHDSAVGTYGEGAAAHRVAYAALKHQYEKKGDRWVAKGWKGPSDPQAAQGYKDPPKPTARGKVARTEEEARQKAKEAAREDAQARRRRAG
ncbi:MAG: ChaB family protein [Bryobacteraceae bacterium]|nr:ChaB family protein [Bryobacteraceae bacterium]